MKHMYSSTDPLDGSVASMVYLMTTTKDKPTLVTHIWTRPDLHGKGFARELFNQVLKDADDENVVLMLSITPDPGGMSYEQLHDWYLRCGFRYYSDGDNDGYQDPTMLREPGVKRVYDI
jgi:GNAT superfamily N-acetyltransferase